MIAPLFKSASYRFKINFYNQQILKPKHPCGHKDLTIVQILKSVEKMDFPQYNIIIYIIINFFYNKSLNFIIDIFFV